MSYLAIFILALLSALLFAPGYRKGSYIPLATFILVVFLAGLASQYWLIPFGPLWWGISWVPLLFTIIIVSILFATPPPYARSGKKSDELIETTEIATVGTVLGLLIWVLIIMLLIAIIVGIFKGPTG